MSSRFSSQCSVHTLQVPAANIIFPVDTRETYSCSWMWESHSHLWLKQRSSIHKSIRYTHISGSGHKELYWHAEHFHLSLLHIAAGLNRAGRWVTAPSKSLKTLLTFIPQLRLLPNGPPEEPHSTGDISTRALGHRSTSDVHFHSIHAAPRAIMKTSHVL